MQKKICERCRGHKIVLGLGMIKKSCTDCLATGYITVAITGNIPENLEPDLSNISEPESSPEPNKRGRKKKSQKA